MRWLLLLGLVLLLALQYRLWVSDSGWPEVWRLRSAAQSQQQENETQRERNEQLSAEVEDLKEGVAAVEERARSELGMIRRDESFYQVVKPAPESSDERE